MNAKINSFRVLVVTRTGNHWQQLLPSQTSFLALKERGKGGTVRDSTRGKELEFSVDLTELRKLLPDRESAAALEEVSDIHTESTILVAMPI